MRRRRKNMQYKEERKENIRWGENQKNDHTYKLKKEKREIQGGEEEKLDGVGPVDNRHSTNKLHHFVWIKI